MEGTAFWLMLATPEKLTQVLGFFTTCFIARLRLDTKAPADRAFASAPFAFSILSTKALPTTAASAKPAIQAACFGVEIPKPTPTGNDVARRTRATSERSRLSSARRAPVTPVTET